MRQEKGLNTKMANRIHHIGLQIAEKDLQLFYIDILRCVIIREFNLSKEEAFSIFNLSKAVRIIYTRCEGIEMEFFVDSSAVTQTFNHICIHSDIADEIASKANSAGFRVYTRKKNDNTKTYFISDSNHNVFEIKNNIIA